MSRTLCQVESITPLTETVFKVVLTPEHSFDFVAGQYLTIVLSEEDKRPFSIASKPGERQLELHIGAFVAESYAMQVMEHLRTHSAIEIEAPLGNASLRPDNKRSRIMVAGGTGFSYIHSMLQQLLAESDKRTTFLYWGCRDLNGMYLKSVADKFSQLHPHLSFIPVFDEMVEGYRQGSVIEAVCDDFSDLSGYDIYVAGRFEMAAVARDKFTANGALTEHLIGDAFAFLK
ncbi:NAD(P)H-flavin reductase [Ferrimonas lipolytica]|uniref:NAD(P)H-flavin reductase n=1 Tax=Ferrimonas lipolytica TaxID=2724191 RepID=A0A6H1UGQ0_9GAMM|nr:NAD(P)H-flavin reductase [Ferrimonas lipolytica]QIZ77998.1 NAD(P)H-flavin reductase [Ferrimonas lipolytica]